MGWFVFLAGVLGFVLVYFSNIPPISPDYGAYLSIGALAGLDAVIGGARAAQEGTFRRRIFISGFLVTVVLAMLLMWFGERIGVDIGLAAVFVFVYRIMQNFSIIRWHLLDRSSLSMPWARQGSRPTAAVGPSSTGSMPDVLHVADEPVQPGS